MKAGAATELLDLAPGHPLGGYADRDGGALGASGELSVRAVALGTESADALLLSLDLLHAPTDLTTAIRSRVTAELGLPPAAVLVCATHTHCGPRDITLRADAELVGSIAAVAAAAARRAIAGMTPVRLVSSEVTGLDVARNRRSSSEVDDAAQLVLIERTEGEHPTGHVVATLVNMACHPTVLSAATLTYDPDFVGPLRALVEDAVGGVCVYLQGFAGDANPVYLDRSTTETRRVGTRAAGPLLRELTAMLATGRRAHVDDLSRSEAVGVEMRGRRLHDGTVTTAQERVTVVARDFAAAPQRPLADASAVAAEEWVTDLLRASHGNFLSSDPLPTPGDESTLPVHAITIGDGLAILALPGEPLHAARATAVAQLPDRHVLTVGYANAAVGYLPPRPEFDRSGYEVGATRFAPGTVETLVDAAVGLVAPRTGSDA